MVHNGTRSARTPSGRGLAGTLRAGVRDPRRAARVARRWAGRRVLDWAARSADVDGVVARSVPVGPPPPGSCLVCHSPGLRERTVNRRGRDFALQICAGCGYVANPTNTVDYTAFESVESFELTPRVGTRDRPGREFAMATLGVSVLRRKGLQVNVFGAGRSLDYLHIRELPGVQRAVISDVVDLGLDGDFVNILDGGTQRYDLVIACEVVEHFLDPNTEFGRLFDLLTPGGLLICSTNLHDGGDLAKQAYLYRRGHTSYYAPRTIARIASSHGLHFDFRVPQMATTVGGPRKRYLLFSRSARVMDQVKVYFGRTMYAPSEKDPKAPGRAVSRT